MSLDIPVATESFRVIDSLYNKLKELGFGEDFTWSIISHLRKQVRIPNIRTYGEDQGSYQLIVEQLGLLSEPGTTFSYETSDEQLYIYGYKLSWKKMKLSRDNGMYHISILES